MLPASLVVLVPSVRLSAQATPTAFVDVNVVPMDQDRVLIGQTVIVQGNRIIAMGATPQITVPVGATHIEGHGKYLIPGLADMHAHLRGGEGVDEVTLLLFVANGVTTIRDMHSGHRPGRRDLVSAADQAQLFSLQQRTASGRLLGPRIYTAGDPDVTSPAAAAQSVAELKADGHTFVKVTEEFTGPLYDSVSAAARRLHMPIVGHAPFIPLDTLLASGQWVSLEHLYPYYSELLPWSPYGPKNNPFVQANILGQPMDPDLLATLPRLIDTSSWMRPTYHLDPERLHALAEATRKAGVWNCPTLWSSYNDLSAWPDTAAQTRMRPGMEPAQPIDESQATDDQSRAMLASLKAIHRLLGFSYEIVKALEDAGAGLLLGTDMLAPGDKSTLPVGFSVVGELREFVQAGLTPYQALATATRNPAVFLHAEDSTGTIAVGKRADLVLLDRNPLADVMNVAGPAGVMLGGRWLPRAELEAKLDSARTWGPFDLTAVRQAMWPAHTP